MAAYLITALVMYALASIVRLVSLATGTPPKAMTLGTLAWMQAISTGFAAWAAYLLFVVRP